MFGNYLSRALIYIISFALTAGVAFAAGKHDGGHGRGQSDKPKMTKHEKASISKLTKNKHFGVEMIIEGDELKKGMNAIDIKIQDSKDKDVPDADVEVEPWMTKMGHGVDEVPVVTSKGGGLYRVEGINVIMMGDWELRILIETDEAEDTVVFSFPGMKAKAVDDFIKVTSPAGYEVVLGRANPLEELKPEIITENGQQIKVFRITVTDTALEVHPGTFFEGWGFNGTIPGPTIRVNEGDRVRVIMGNETEVKHTFHVHGIRKPVVMDGVPYLGQKPIEKGETYTYEFTAETPGTSFYHCHVDSAHHVDMGMYGAFIVEPNPEPLKYDREYVFILDEFPTGHVHVHEDAVDMEEHDEHGVVTVHPGEPVHEDVDEKPKKRNWYPETYNPYEAVYDAFTINGKAFPFTEPIDVKEGERVRIRIVNTGYESHYIHTHAHKFQLTHRDGLPLKEPIELDTVEVGSGQRVDILLIADNPGIWPVHCHRLNHVANDKVYPGGMLTFIRYLE